MECLWQAVGFSLGGYFDDIDKIPRTPYAIEKGICATGISTSWQLNFYAAGGIGVFFTLLFACMATNTPFESVLISEEERRYCLRYAKKDANSVVAKVEYAVYSVTV